MAQLMPLPLTVSCFSKIQISFTFLVPADPGSPGKRAVKPVCVCVCVVVSMTGEDYLSEQGIAHSSLWHLWQNELALLLITLTFLLLTYVQLRRTNTTR